MIRIVQLYPRDMNLYGDWATPACSKNASNGAESTPRSSTTTPATTPTSDPETSSSAAAARTPGRTRSRKTYQHHIDELGRLVEDGARCC